MTENRETTGTVQEALKEIRALRQEAIGRIADRVKKQRREIKTIKEALRQGPRTVPELAEIIDLSSTEIFWYLAALKKYGEIVEGEKAGSYFRYALAGEGSERNEIK
jgi:predicted transcriptional regulator